MRVSGRQAVPHFGRMVLFAAAVTLCLGAPALPGTEHDKGAAHGTEVLLLNCMDYRLVDHTAHYMAKRGLKGKYDDIVLAGAALGAVTDQHPAWNETFWDELG